MLLEHVSEIEEQLAVDRKVRLVELSPFRVLAQVHDFLRQDQVFEAVVLGYVMLPVYHIKLVACYVRDLVSHCPGIDESILAGKAGGNL